VGSPPEEPVSPELALVDSGLRGRLATHEGTATEEGAGEPSSAGASRSRRSRRSRVGIVLLLLLAVVVAAVAAAVLIRRADTSASTPAPVARNFAWAPVKGATAYVVEIRRDGAVVYTARPTAARVTVPARWQRGARSFALTPGTYQWDVWPVRRSGTGDRRGPAVVATTFRVGRD